MTTSDSLKEHYFIEPAKVIFLVALPQNYLGFWASKEREGFGAVVESPEIWFNELDEIAQMPGMTSERLLWHGAYNNRRAELNRAAERNLKIVFGAALSDVQHAFENFRYIHLWAHTRNEGSEVELADGFVGATDFAKSIPADFSGFVDLTACSGAILAQRIRQRAPLSLIIAIDIDDKISGWLGGCIVSTKAAMLSKGSDILSLHSRAVATCMSLIRTEVNMTAVDEFFHEVDSVLATAPSTGVVELGDDAKAPKRKKPNVASSADGPKLADSARSASLELQAIPTSNNRPIYVAAALVAVMGCLFVAIAWIFRNTPFALAPIGSAGGFFVTSVLVGRQMVSIVETREKLADHRARQIVTLAVFQQAAAAITDGPSLVALLRALKIAFPVDRPNT